MKIDLNDILDNIYGGVYYVDKNRKIKYWNKEAEKITGFSKEEVIGEYCYNNILQHVDAKGLIYVIMAVLYMPQWKIAQKERQIYICIINKDSEFQ